MDFDAVGARLSASVARAPPPASIARVGLGSMVFAAGVHKLFDPLAWTVYVVDWLAPVLVVSPVVFMLVNGVLEIGFGAALVADRYTAVASAVAAVSLTATCLYLGVVFVLEGGLFGDVLARDVGLAGLAWAVLVDALSRPTRTG
ncbi:DoxX family membrane protein [Haloferax sp. MBLA0076]|uniref:DoxX family membrane protein n=1 Tax=Haloferax litoreum TaxID=2666140 RepID=A0A6A8GJ43_9EURY|nr:MULTISPECIES: DoxX family membrane protein [Haloferax]KAB1194328.1 DoxX family membrane protein [Haloferax sp. CBA1148]MRX22889.1 DoxX family membrane protein [Haloferax litoreum]